MSSTVVAAGQAGNRNIGGRGGGGEVSGSSPGESSSSASAASPAKLPTAATFAFKAPALPLKQRRVSLALPSSPRVVEGWNFRDDTGLDSVASNAEGASLMSQEKKKIRKVESPEEKESGTTTPEKPEKKARKKWTLEETAMLVAGCNKTVSGRTTPDAYRQHYPNAKTHLSNKVRSTLPDGKPLFEKTRSKRRRPFTEEEDRALKEGYEKYGTVWATIVKDYPIFQEQNRRSTDLRDRFRNAFPELYSLAGYKPRNAAKKKMAAAAMADAKRAATDDQLGTTSTGGPVRSRRRAHTHQGLRGGTKSVPQSTANTEDEDSSGGEEEGTSSPAFQVPQTPVLESGASSPKRKSPDQPMAYDMSEDEEMDMITMDPLAEALALPDLLSNNEGHSHAWSSGVSTPTHSNHWSTAAGSPTSSHLSSDMLMNHSSPFLQRRSDSNNNMGMIGKSAWGTDWFSPNPRLDPSSNGAASSSSYLDHPSPHSPFSFHQLNHGVMDRYDLFPSTMPSDFSSEVGIGDSHSTFSDELFQPSGFRGFTHHSSYAGDLIFGARTHQPHQSFVNGGFGFGSLGLTGMGLGQQQQQNAGIHPMQLHTPSNLPGIDEAGHGGIGGLALEDRAGADPLGIPLPPESMDEDLREDVAMGDHHHHSHAAAMQQLQQQQQQRVEVGTSEASNNAVANIMSEPFCLDDLVDLSHDHDGQLGSLHSINNTTPPATPGLTTNSRDDTAHPRPLRRSSGSVLHQFSNPGSLHARSVSVPPSEYRNNNNGGGQYFAAARAGGGGRYAGEGGRWDDREEEGEGSRAFIAVVAEGLWAASESSWGLGLGLGGGVNPGNLDHRASGTAVEDDADDDDDEEGDDERPQTPTLASSRQMLSPVGMAPSLSSSSTASSSSVASNSSVASRADDGWRAPPFGQGGLNSTFSSSSSSGMGGASTSSMNLNAELYNLPFWICIIMGVGMRGWGCSRGWGEFGFGGMEAEAAQALDLARTVGPGRLGHGGGGGGDGGFGAAYKGLFGHHGLQQQQIQHVQPGTTPTGGFMQEAFGGQHRQQQQQQGQGQQGQQMHGGMGMFKPNGMGRSQSHHRGQSAVVGGVTVDPRDLVVGMGMGEGNKRKRASWDGRQV
ncbi:hypothetical protein DFP72DRAFT_1035605 [Ephemerocybe angulata]|uniref:Uncharacterized protein n=1 Tax=Ephemerocybe angulata TaxID=980116 RepID=A0A8H6HEL0_9AGAR|nr:hypothetical protein DFP72DRAFT_1035605 [Tulosesus angulatus]